MRLQSIHLASPSDRPTARLQGCRGLTRACRPSSPSSTEFRQVESIWLTRLTDWLIAGRIHSHRHSSQLRAAADCGGRRAECRQVVCARELRGQVSYFWCFKTQTHWKKRSLKRMPIFFVKQRKGVRGVKKLVSVLRVWGQQFRIDFPIAPFASLECRCSCPFVRRCSFFAEIPFRCLLLLLRLS